MPVEIREIVIKTVIHTEENSAVDQGLSREETNELRKQLLTECKRMINEGTKRKKHKR